MAQSQKVFRETLCESRSYGVETLDPIGARTIDELRRQVKELKFQVEGEKMKSRQAQRDHEKKLQQLRDEEAVRLDTALEACSVRKEQEKLNELKKLEEKLDRQRDQDLRMLRKEKVEELNRSLRKWQLEKNEAVRLAAEVERRRSSEEFQAQYAEDEAQGREAKLTREVFILGEQNESLEEQVRSLSKLNRAQIDQMRRLKLECDTKVEGIIKQQKVEASREIAQLKLAEQIAADKEHHLRHFEYQAMTALMEKEALQDELAAVKSIQNTSTMSSSMHETSLQDTPGGTPSRRSGLLQKRVEELERQVRKLEEERGTLKQDNAVLRKRLVHDDDDKKGGGAGKSAEVKVLRKKNTELTALAKQLDDKYRALKLEHDQLPKPRVNEKEGGENVKKILARQHAKDISEYTKQIMGKDKELNILKKKVSKLETIAASNSEPSPELEKKMKLMALDKLQMERVMAKLYSRLPDVVDTENLSHKDLTADSQKMDDLRSENESLKGDIQSLRLQLSSVKDSRVAYSSGMSEKEASSKIASLEQENARLASENERLTELSQSASQLELKVRDLQETVEHLEEVNAKLEQTSHKLGQELQISSMAVRELQDSQDTMAELEKDVGQLKDELRLKKEKFMVQKKEASETSNQVIGMQVIINTLQDNLEQAELKLGEKERLCSSLQATVDQTRQELEAVSHTASSHSMGTQVDLPDGKEELKPSGTVSVPTFQSVNSRDAVLASFATKPLPTTTEAEATAATSTTSVPFARSNSDGGLPRRQFSPSKPQRTRSPKRRPPMPRTSSGELHDTSLDHEMRAAGFSLNESGDSSEGVGFSDPNLDVVELELDSSHKTQQQDGPPLPKVAWEEKTGGGGGAGGGGSGVLQRETDQAQATLDGGIVEPAAAGGGGGVAKEAEEDDSQAQLNKLLSGTKTEPDSDEDTMNDTSHYSYDSEGDLPPSSSGRKAKSDAPGWDSPSSYSDGDKVGIYLAKYTYVPADMSPNENHDLELPLTAGDYLYVYGEMDSDGFYHGQLLSSGQSGMVPSNFIEKVMDEEETHMPPKMPQGLHNIEEVDEDVSSSSGRGIPPPVGLTLDRQFVEGDQYSVAIKWEQPRPLPADVTGYNVYVNGEFHEDVAGAENTSVLVTGVPRKKLVKISVRTATEEGESANPQKLVVLNPQYPESPTNVMVSKSAEPTTCLLVQWTPSRPLQEGNIVSGYIVCLNKDPVVEVGTNSVPVKTVCAQVFPNDVKEIKASVLKDKSILMTVHARSGDYMSSPSQPLVLSREDFVHVCGHGKNEGIEPASSEASLSSVEDREERKEVGSGLIRRPNGKDRSEFVEKGVEIVTVEANGIENDKEGTPNGNYDAAKFFRAMASYNPHMQSPNKDSAHEELGFAVDDIIICITDVDEDGFLMGELDGKTGYVPSNLVEEVMDNEELNEIRSILRERGTLRRDQQDLNGSGLLRGGGGGDGVRIMVAEYDYNPEEDSPNENSEVELPLIEGQRVTVFGWADEDGFVKAEVSGKKGLVPGNYLKEAKTTGRGGSEVEVFAADEEDMKQADAIIGGTRPAIIVTQKADEETTKKKGSVLSRGKNLFTRGKKGGQ